MTDEATEEEITLFKAVESSDGLRAHQPKVCVIRDNVDAHDREHLVVPAGCYALENGVLVARGPNAEDDLCPFTITVEHLLHHSGIIL